MGRPPISKESWGKIQVKQLDDGRVRARARVRDQDGWTRDVTRIRGSETAAVRALKKELKDRTTPPRGAIRPTTRLQAVADEYFRLLEQDVDAGTKGPQTLRDYKSKWKTSLAPRVGGWQVREVDAELCVKVLEEIRTEYAASTTGVIRAVFSQILQLAYNRGALTKNPLYRSGIRVAGERKKPIVALEPRQIQELIVRLAADEKAVALDFPDLMFWMVSVGDRIGGALALRWPRVDLENKTVEIGRNMIIGKDGKPEMNERDSGKVNIRTISIPDPAVDMLRRRWGKNSPLGGRWDPLGPVFAGKFGQPRRQSQVHRTLRPALDRAGFEGLKPHTMRKTNATALARAGLSMDEVAALLGHRSVETTRGYYAKPEFINPTAVAALAALMTPDPSTQNVVHGNFG